MTQKIAVAVVHGVGSQKADFAKAFATRLKDRFADEIRGPSAMTRKRRSRSAVSIGPGSSPLNARPRSDGSNAQRAACAEASPDA